MRKSFYDTILHMVNVFNVVYYFGEYLTVLQKQYES